jgi:glycosidase
MASPLDSAVFRLPVARSGRDRFMPETRYEDPPLGFPAGFVPVVEATELHRLAIRLREASHDGEVVGGGEVAAYAALSETLAYILSHYRIVPGAGDALSGLDAQLGDVLGEGREELLVELAAAYPAGPVERGETTAGEFVRPAVERGPARESMLASLLLLGAARRNVALTPLRPIFASPEVDHDRVDHALAVAATFFETKPRLGPEHQTLVELLLAPGLAAPSLGGQLDFVLERWPELVPDSLKQRLLRARDELTETHRAPTQGGAGPAELPEVSRAPGAGGAADTSTSTPARGGAPTRRGASPSEAYRAVREQPWMGETVVVAKNTKVWLHQLSERYGQAVDRLDQIPDMALEALAGRGFNALWLIGLWERSLASRRIKRRRGHMDAEASAYSLYDYRVAQDLGGDEALDHLRERAAGYGLRLAADMVPNHTGLYSAWVVEHPEWFLSGEEPPYPSYTFTGPDLARDPRIEVRVEDGYWDHSDAAVVFERLDRETGERRYLYHGNDGTQMPWNDTAQLDFTQPEVRAAVLETILQVAQRFPVLRFDAAMTLTRYHYQRLWFPWPGSGGAVPSRSRYGMSVAEFEARMPKEFWREVIEAAAERVPDALFMAEAFWLTETFFVRELGMHRVYNSAFMKMLSAERNAEYRAFLAEIAVQDPALLGRFVNFMTNPDEEPASALFGKGDKYLGVATLLVTLPGLPMFGHGQVEGFTEKYGMEFQRSYWSEEADTALVRRHYEELVPLLRRRGLFTTTEHFRLFDVVRDDGTVAEDVFAYVNGDERERVLVLYNNTLESVRGRLHWSVPQASQRGSRAVGDGAETGESAARGPRRYSLAEALGVAAGAAGTLVLRDMRSGLEWLVRAEEVAERGVEVVLKGYQSVVWRLEPTAAAT